jgi:hypothetical protein
MEKETHSTIRDIAWHSLVSLIFAKDKTTVTCGNYGNKGKKKDVQIITEVPISMNLGQRNHHVKVPSHRCKHLGQILPVEPPCNEEVLLSLLFTLKNPCNCFLKISENVHILVAYLKCLLASSHMFTSNRHRAFFPLINLPFVLKNKEWELILWWSSPINRGPSQGCCIPEIQVLK